MIEASAFRQYDIRGKIGEEISIEGTYDLARAIVAYLAFKKPAMRTIAVARDGRTHSPAIHENVCAAIVASGLDVVDLGMCPSPTLYFSLHTMPYDAGIMITASHNTREYNGFKLCLGRESLWGRDIEELRAWYFKGAHLSSPQRGHIREHPINDAYCGWLASHFWHLAGRELPIVVDCGNGVAGTVMPTLVDMLGLRGVRLLYADVDGTYPHHTADPIIEENMADVRYALAGDDSLMYGIGLDGDADRMAPMTRSGYLVPGDKLLALLAQPVLAKNPGATIVCDITSSLALVRTLESWGARVLMVPTGHANIKAALKREHALMGGELSCHFTFADRYFGFDDGIYAMMRLIELLQETHESLSELLHVFPTVYNCPALRVPCDPAKVPAVVDTIQQHFATVPGAHLVSVDGVRVTMPYGWGLARASNTQPVICLRFESDTPEGFERIKRDFAVLLERHMSREVIDTYLP